MRAVRADAPEEAGEERHNADLPLLEEERDVGMRGMLTGMFSKLMSQVGVGTQVGEERRDEDEEWETADFQDADLEERVEAAVTSIAAVWRGLAVRRRRASAATSIAAAWRGFAERGGWFCRTLKLTRELQDEHDRRESWCDVMQDEHDRREKMLDSREEELQIFESQLDTEVECRQRGGLICDVCDTQMVAGFTPAVTIVGANIDFCVDCVVEEALSRVDAGDAGMELVDLLPSNLLKLAFNAVPFEMAYERAPWQPPVEATDRPPPTTPTRPLRRTDGPQSGGHGGPQSGGRSGPRTGRNKTKQDKRKAKKARQKEKRRAAKAASVATKPSSPPVSPPDSLSSSSPRSLDVQETKQPSGEARHATAPQPNNPRTPTPRRSVGGVALTTTPARAAAATQAAAASAARSGGDGEEDEECGAGVGW